MGSRRVVRIGPLSFSARWLLTLVWLFYLHDTFTVAIHLDPVARRVVSLVLLVGFCLLYGYGFSIARVSQWRARDVGPVVRGSVVVGALALTLAVTLLVGQTGLALLVYDAVMAIMLLRAEVALGTVVALIAAVEITARTVPGWEEQNGLAIALVLASVAVWGISQMIARNVELAQAQQEIARLAVSRERDRFARDLHDLLGHTLTVITMKSELAGRLVPLAPERAEQEIAEVERLARDALADVRAAVAGYREVTLATELVSARTALDAAGIVAELPSAVDEVPGERRELFGWAVREGVTNVVRHSGAERCRVVLSRNCVEIVDDGVGVSGSGGGSAELEHEASTSASHSVPAGGQGLRGLRERAEAVGAGVSVGHGDAGRGFRLRVGW
ncbi:hypothetical protein JCM9957A_13000 [Kineosporia succinea]